MRSEGRAAALRLAALTVGPACLVGQAIMLAERAPLALLLTNLAALVGGLVAAALWAGRLDDLITARPGRVLGAGLVLVVAAFPFASTGGVHRWWLLGPVRVHASALCAPLVMVAVVRLWRLRRWRAAAAGAAAIQALHVLQPDAGQATAVGLALAVAAVGLVGRAPRERERDLGVGLAAVAAGAGAALAWLRLDGSLGTPAVRRADSRRRVRTRLVVGGAVGVGSLGPGARAVVGRAALAGRGRFGRDARAGRLLRRRLARGRRGRVSRPRAWPWHIARGGSHPRGGAVGPSRGTTTGRRGGHVGLARRNRRLSSVTRPSVRGHRRGIDGQESARQGPLSFGRLVTSTDSS